MLLSSSSLDEVRLAYLLNQFSKLLGISRFSLRSTPQLVLFEPYSTPTRFPAALHNQLDYDNQ